MIYFLPDMPDLLNAKPPPVVCVLFGGRSAASVWQRTAADILQRLAPRAAIVLTSASQFPLSATELDWIAEVADEVVAWSGAGSASLSIDEWWACGYLRGKRVPLLLGVDSQSAGGPTGDYSDFGMLIDVAGRRLQLALERLYRGA